MKGDYKQVTCDPTCGFQIKSHDDRELKRFVKEHAKNVHKMDVTDKDVEDKMTAA